jgi:hypothetical protein
MPKVTLNPTLRSISGKMGDVVFRTNRKTGRTTISKAPDMTKVKWSKAQKVLRRRFKAVYQERHDPTGWVGGLLGAGEEEAQASLGSGRLRSLPRHRPGPQQVISGHGHMTQEEAKRMSPLPVLFLTYLLRVPFVFFEDCLSGDHFKNHSLVIPVDFFQSGILRSHLQEISVI